GASTDANGAFELTVESLQDTLVASYIGYQTQEVPINGQTGIDIELNPESIMGEEMVVVGYGTQEREQITSSISSVASEDFTSGAVNNPTELIQGKVPGLIVSTPGANPNESPTLRLRGISSFGNNEPLIVVDGIIGASMDNIDPNDIKSIDVMKDASAAAIYGTRGGAGVIAITTKKGQAGQTKVSYKGDISLMGVENKIDVLSADQFRQLSKTTGIEIEDLGANTDWFDEITQTSYTQIHNLSISGGTESTTYRFSGNFRDNQGLLKHTGFQQKGGRMNINHYALDDKLVLTLNLSATSHNQDVGIDNAFRQAVTFNPTAPVKSEGFKNTGGYTELSGYQFFNPVAILETSKNVREFRDINAAVKADYNFDDLVPGLTASGFYSLHTFDASHNVFYGRTSKFGGGASPSSFGSGHAERQTDKSSTEQFDMTLNYSTQALENLGVEVLTGYSYVSSEYEGTTVGGGDFVSDETGFNNLEFIQDFNKGLGDISSYKNDDRIIAGFGRINLDWNNTYYLNGTIRREGSTRFERIINGGHFGLRELVLSL